MNSLILSVIFYSVSFNHCAYERTDTTLSTQIIPIESSFNSIKIYSDITVYITEGDRNEIVVKNEEVANNIKFKVEDGILLIRGRKVIFNRNNHDKIIISERNINCITVMGDAEVRTIGDVCHHTLTLEIYGDGAIYISTKADEVNTFIKGLGKIEVKGNFNNTSVNKDAYGNMVTTYNKR